MSYMALYRTYRPQKFSEVIGQRHIVRTLQNAIKLNKVAHAYLFCGPRGTGKTTMAKIMAKALNCQEGMNEEPCCKCDNCIGITNGKISDVIEMDAASNNGIDEIRDIRDKVKLMPAYGRYKVYIIDEVHMLSTQAFNALLKTLEEPPSYCVFILCTTDPQKIPMTILSRCQRFDFLGISAEDVKTNIKRVSEKENFNITDEAMDLISEACEGGMRDALSLLDQSVSFASNGVVDIDAVTMVSGSVNKNYISKIIKCAYESNQEEMLKTINEVISLGKEIDKINNDIISYIRDLLMYKAHFGSKAIYNDETFKELSKIPQEYLYSYLEELNNVAYNIKATNQKRCYLELGLLKLADAKINDYNELLSKVSEMEARLSFLERKKVEYSKSSEETLLKNDVIIKPIELKNNAILSEKENVAPILNNIEIDDSFITTNDILDVLNNGDKNLKNKARDIVSGNYENQVLSIFKDISVEAVGNNKIILVLPTLGMCNMLMKDKNYNGIIDLFNQEELNINEIYALPRDCWGEIIRLYAIAYKNKEKPNLSSVKILVKKHVETKSIDDNIDDICKELFPNEKIIVE